MYNVVSGNQRAIIAVVRWISSRERNTLKRFPCWRNSARKRWRGPGNSGNSRNTNGYILISGHFNSPFVVSCSIVLFHVLTLKVTNQHSLELFILAFFKNHASLILVTKIYIRYHCVAKKTLYYN